MGGKRRKKPDPLPKRPYRPPVHAFDQDLVDRAEDLHRRLEAAKRRHTGLEELAPEHYKQSKRWGTVAIVEDVIDGKPVRVVATNNVDYLRLLEAHSEDFLLPGEELANHSVRHGFGTHDGHAERIAMNHARERGGVGGRVAASNLGCDKCVSLAEDYESYRPANPKRGYLQPARTASGEIDVPDKPPALSQNITDADRGITAASKLASNRLGQAAARSSQPSAAALTDDVVEQGIRRAGAPRPSMAVPRGASRFLAATVIEVLLWEALARIDEYFRQKAMKRLTKVIFAHVKKVYPSMLKRKKKKVEDRPGFVFEWVGYVKAEVPLINAGTRYQTQDFEHARVVVTKTDIVPSLLMPAPEDDERTAVQGDFGEFTLFVRFPINELTGGSHWGLGAWLAADYTKPEDVKVIRAPTPNSARAELLEYVAYARQYRPAIYREALALFGKNLENVALLTAGDPTLARHERYYFVVVKTSLMGRRDGPTEEDLERFLQELQ